MFYGLIERAMTGQRNRRLSSVPKEGIRATPKAVTSTPDWLPISGFCCSCSSSNASVAGADPPTDRWLQGLHKARMQRNCYMLGNLSHPFDS